MYHDVDIIVSTTLPTLDVLNTYKNGWDALLLYFRYVRQARLQKTNTTYSKDTFMAEWMKWSMNKFYKVKKILTENNLIETVYRHWEDGRMEGTYVQINFIIKEKQEQESVSTVLLKNQSMEKPLYGKKDTNAWSNININAWRELNINAWEKNGFEYEWKKYSKTDAASFVYKNYFNRVPKEKRKWSKSAQAIWYITSLLKEFSMTELVNSANNYLRQTESTYIMATQYFYSNSMKGKQYRVFVDYIKEEKEEKVIIDANIF